MSWMNNQYSQRSHNYLECPVASSVIFPWKGLLPWNWQSFHQDCNHHDEYLVPYFYWWSCWSEEIVRMWESILSISFCLSYRPQLTFSTRVCFLMASLFLRFSFGFPSVHCSKSVSALFRKFKGSLSIIHPLPSEVRLFITQRNQDNFQPIHAKIGRLLRYISAIFFGFSAKF